jgi:hypothetical protein
MPILRALSLALLACAACAPRQAETHIDRSTVMDERGSIVEMTAITEARLDSLPAAVPAALPIVRNAYRALGLEPNVVDPPKGIVGLRQGTVTRQLQGVPLTAYLDCGADVNGVPFAANDRIELSMVTEITAMAGGGSRMSTMLAARAMRTSSGASVNPQRCSSRGTLERKLHEVAKGAR